MPKFLVRMETTTVYESEVEARDAEEAATIAQNRAEEEGPDQEIDCTAYEVTSVRAINP